MIAHPSFAGIPLVLGGNVFGDTADEGASFAVLDRFYAMGGRMIDTAQGYSIWVPGHVGGESETVLGKWLDSRGVRAEMVISTKTGMRGNPGDLAPAKVAEELDRSLDRLRTSFADVYYVHKPEPGRDFAEIAEGFAASVASGKAKLLGVSNFTLDQLLAVNAAADAAGTTRFTVLQNECNLVQRDDFPPALAAHCQAQAIAHYPWMGLASGFLTGKYRSKEDLRRFVRGGSVKRFFEKGLPVLPVLDAVVAETGASHGAVALAWLAAQPGITAPIASASRPEQLDLHAEALALELSAEQLARLGAASS